MFRSFRVCFLLTCLALATRPATLDFEGLSDGIVLTSEYSGVSFSNAIILTSGVSLNEFEFPPRSGTNVASDDGGPMSINFASAVSSFSGYFTYAEPLTISAFSNSNVLLSSTISPFSDNEAMSGFSGSSPNELLQISSSIGISYIRITGDPFGSSFTIDDADLNP